jgi:hypothetical protein
VAAVQAQVALVAMEALAVAVMAQMRLELRLLVERLLLVKDLTAATALQMAMRVVAVVALVLLELRV